MIRRICCEKVRGTFGSTLDCSERAVVERNGKPYCERHDPGERAPAAPKPLEARYASGQFVELIDGRVGRIVSIAPPGKPLAVVAFDIENQTAEPVHKGAIKGLAQDASYQGVKRAEGGKQRGRRRFLAEHARLEQEQREW